MPLHVPPAPPAALRTVLAALGNPAAVRHAHTPALRTAQGPLSPELPLPVHVLERITAEGVPVIRLAGWRFLIRSGDHSVAAADTVHTADGWAFSHFFEGPYVSSTERALRQAEEASHAYQPRLLSVPGLYMLTLWLHADVMADGSAGLPDERDLLIPLAPAPPGIASHRPHHVAELLSLLTRRVGPAGPPPPALSPAA
jgi:hypothetical protein